MTEVPTTAARCANCRFWKPEHQRQPDDWDKGECRRHGPVLQLIVRTQEPFHPSGEWPWTVGGDWCGDFETKP